MEFQSPIICMMLPRVPSSNRADSCAENRNSPEWGKKKKKSQAKAGEKATALARFVAAGLSPSPSPSPLRGRHASVHLTVDLTAGISRGGAVAVQADSAPGPLLPASVALPVAPSVGPRASRWAKDPGEDSACRGAMRSGPRNLTAGRTDVSCGGAVSFSVWGLL